MSPDAEMAIESTARGCVQPGVANALIQPARLRFLPTVGWECLGYIAIASSAKYSDIAAPSLSLAARAHVFAARRSSSPAPDRELGDTVGLAAVEDVHAPKATPAASKNPIARPRTGPRCERSACAISIIRFITMFSRLTVCVAAAGRMAVPVGRGRQLAPSWRIIVARSKYRRSHSIRSSSKSNTAQKRTSTDRPLGGSPAHGPFCVPVNRPSTITAFSE
jgi:hypothetical protein